MSVERELRNVIARLELVSHVSAVSLESSDRDTSDDIGGQRPPGGLERKDERRDGVYDGQELFFTLKSADHFKRRLETAHTDRALRQILEDAQRSLAAFQRTPIGGEPPRCDPQWKRWVAESNEADGAIAFRHGVSRQYVNRIRNAYRGLV